MIPILLLDLAGVVLVAGYVLLDRRQRGSHRLPLAEPIDSPAGRDTRSGGLPIEPIVAQRPNAANLEPRRIRRPSGRPRSAGSADR